MRIPSVVAAWIRRVRVVRAGWTLDCWHWAVEKCKVSGGFKKWIPFSHLSQILYELEKKSSLVTRALSAKILHSWYRQSSFLHSAAPRARDGLSVSLVQDFAEKALVPKLDSYNRARLIKWVRIYFNKWNLHSIYLLHTVSDGKCI